MRYYHAQTLHPDQARFPIPGLNYNRVILVIVSKSLLHDPYPAKNCKHTLHIYRDQHTIVGIINFYTLGVDIFIFSLLAEFINSSIVLFSYKLKGFLPLISSNHKYLSSVCAFML
jgi:hypothetical protein